MRGPRPDTTLQVNLVGHCTSDRAAYGSQLAQAGIPCAEVSLDRDALLDLARGRPHPPAGAPHALTLVHAQPHELADALQHVPAATHAAGYTVGYWFWDPSHFPLALADAFALVDEVWAPSRFVFDALHSLARVPLRLMPPCVPAPTAPSSTRGA